MSYVIGASNRMGWRRRRLRRRWESLSILGRVRYVVVRVVAALMFVLLFVEGLASLHAGIRRLF